MLYTIRLKTSPSSRFSIYHKGSGTHVVAFKNKDLARRCITFIAMYKHKYNTFPPIDSESVQLSAAKTPMFPEHLKQLTKDLEILDEREGNLSSLCKLFNVGLLAVEGFNYSFDTSTVNVSYQAISMLQFDPDNTKYEALTYLFFKENE